MMESIGSAKLPTFSGDLGKFQVWWMRFKAYENVNEFVETINRAIDQDMPANNSAPISESTAQGKREAKAKRKNALAKASLTMAFTLASLFGLINQSVNTNWPQGQACRVVKALHRKYMPQVLILRLKMRKEMNGIVMTKEDNPATYFETISGV